MIPDKVKELFRRAVAAARDAEAIDGRSDEPIPLRLLALRVARTAVEDFHAAALLDLLGPPPPEPLPPKAWPPWARQFLEAFEEATWQLDERIEDLEEWELYEIREGWLREDVRDEAGSSPDRDEDQDAEGDSGAVD